MRPWWFLVIAGCGAEASPDAAPRPDAIPPDLACAGAALPTTAADPIVITGHAYVASPLGQSDLAGAVIEPFPTGSATQSARDGRFTLTIANPSMTPLDGYLRARAESYLDTYVYPPAPLAEDPPEAPLMFVTADTLDQLAFTSGVALDPDLGFLGVLVQDCAGVPVAGAVVTAPGPVVYVAPNNFPDTAATVTGANGLAYVFDVPVGEIEVGAAVGDTALRAHTVTARGNAVTTTAVAP